MDDQGEHNISGAVPYLFIQLWREATIVLRRVGFNVHQLFRTQQIGGKALVDKRRTLSFCDRGR